MDDIVRQDGNEELWFQIFAEGHPLLVKKQMRFLRLPTEPRCRLCHAPFAGMGGWLMSIRGLKSSERNEHFCNACDGFLEAFPGGAEVPMSMLILDIRDSVPLSARLSPKVFAQAINRMRDEITGIIAHYDGFVLEFQGDSVVCVWPPGFCGPDYAAKAIDAAKAAIAANLRVPDSDEVLPVGLGVHVGEIYIGTVTASAGRMQSISAFGYPVNVVARLAAAAKAGEALISAETYAAAGREPDADAVSQMELKGVEGLTPVVALST